MNIISATDGSKPYNRRSGSSVGIHDQQNDERGQKHGPKSAHSAGGITDDLDLSRLTQHVLSGLEEDIRAIEDEFPDYQDLIPGYGNTLSSPGLSFLAGANRFLNDPASEIRKEQSASFAAFYKRVKTLNDEHKELMKAAQQQLRDRPPTTYGPGAI